MILDDHKAAVFVAIVTPPSSLTVLCDLKVCPLQGSLVTSTLIASGLGLRLLAHQKTALITILCATIRSSRIPTAVV